MQAWLVNPNIALTSYSSNVWVMAQNGTVFNAVIYSDAQAEAQTEAAGKNSFLLTENILEPRVSIYFSRIFHSDW